MRDRTNDASVNKGPEALSNRASKYREEIEKIVTELGEHPLCEMKRACSVQNLFEKIEFVKDVQSIATSKIEGEKFLVIGADEAAKKFCAVRNQTDFDDAAVRQILSKYLDPVPEIEIFKLASSGGIPFVLVVIPKQRNRRILAKITVEDTSSSKARLLLREGDLWTKGTSTGKRLATPEDWDDIYSESVESQVEFQTRQRTAHALEIAIARERMHASSAPILPSVFNDVQFKALLEDLCATQDVPRFSLLLERLRDDLVEGWYQVGGYAQSLYDPGEYVDEPTKLKSKVREHIRNVFRPAMHWLTLAGIYTVKNTGPVVFLESVIDLLAEVFRTSYRLMGLDFIVPRGVTCVTDDEHVSRTVPALEGLVSLYLIAGFIMKRDRFQYFRSLFRADVFTIGPNGRGDLKAPMVFWPFRKGSGEPESVWSFGGRISYCGGRVKKDSTYVTVFGSEAAAIEAICQLELCLELNSYCAMAGEETEQTSRYLSTAVPNVDFRFWPCLTAFSLENVKALTLRIFDELTHQNTMTLSQVFVDPVLAGYWKSLGSNIMFARFINGLISDQSRAYLQQCRMAPMVYWPKEFGDALKLARKKTV